MAAENIRTSATKGTIPTSTAIAGTFSDVVSSTNLVYTGSVTAESLFGANIQKQQANNLYAYCAAPLSAAHGEVRKITNIKGSSTTWTLTIESAFTGGTGAGATIALVTADLQEFSVTNDGGADGYIDTKVFVSGDTVTVGTSSTRIGRTRTPVAFDATGTTYLITEFK